MTDLTEPLLRLIQVEDLGQQKEDGKSLPHCCKSVFPPHVSACRGKRVDACVTVTSKTKRHRTDIRDSLGADVTGAIAMVEGRICREYYSGEVGPATLDNVTRNETRRL
jgi:hypothetical protein